MKKFLFLLLVFFSVGTVQTFAQEVKKEVKKKTEKKVVIKKKTVKDDGTVVEEVIEAEGEEAEALLKKMKEEEGLEDVEIEMEMDGDLTKKKVRITKDQQTTKGSYGEEKMITVGVDTKKDADGENVFVIKVDDGDGEKEFNWNSEDGQIPEEMKKYMKKGGIAINLDEKGEGEMKEIIVRVESDEDLPEVNVRMGVELVDTEGTVEVGNTQDGSPAAAAGLMKGDLITEIDGYHISGYSGLLKRLSNYQPGDEIDVRYVRNGKASTTRLELAARQ
jgi:membrane-associated protease RseP (regulator of RpoE activity)